MRKILLSLALFCSTAAWATTCSVLNVVITSQGQYHDSTVPTITFSGTGSGAAATANMAFDGTNWYVSSVTLTAGGTYTSSSVTVTFSGGTPTPPPAFALGYAVMSSGCGGGGGSGRKVFAWLL